MELYKNLCLAYKLDKKPAIALKYHEKLLHWKDSIAKAQKHQEIMELQTKYETAKKKATIQKLEKKR